MNNSLMLDLSRKCVHPFDWKKARSQSTVTYAVELDSPVGSIIVGWYHNAVWKLSIGEGAKEKLSQEALLRGLEIRSETNGFTKTVFSEFSEYFFAERRAFTLPVLLQGTTFQLEVWQELNRVSYGSIVSYQELAIRVNRPQAARAIGTVMANNRVPILIPCHRVITASGQLGGFGCGIEVKRFLLNLEAGADMY